MTWRPVNTPVPGQPSDHSLPSRSPTPPPPVSLFYYPAHSLTTSSPLSLRVHTGKASAARSLPAGKPIHTSDWVVGPEQLKLPHSQPSSSAREELISFIQPAPPLFLCFACQTSKKRSSGWGERREEGRGKNDREKRPGRLRLTGRSERHGRPCTGGLRLVRCPKCYNILPEPPNGTVYECGGCNTILRAKIRANNGQTTATKQVRQDSDDFSVATTTSNGVPPQNRELVLSGATMDSSCNPGAPSTETEHDSNGTSSSENGDAMPVEKNASEVTNSKEDCNLDGQSISGRIKGPFEEILPNANGMDVDSDKEETNAVQRIAENLEDCRVSEGDDKECSLNAPEHEVPLPQESKSDSDLKEASTTNKSDSELKEAIETEDEASKKRFLARASSRSCDLTESHRASAGSSLDFHSARTSLQSKNFRASEPLQSKIMKTVEELRGDLSEFFGKPEDECKPKAAACPPRPSKQDGYKARPPFTSSVPLTAYHPAAKHSGNVARLSRSGQVLPPYHHRRELFSLRYRRRPRAYSCCHSEQMEMMRRPCAHECCHSCRPTCRHHGSWKNQEDAMQRPPVQEMKRRLPPRHHCRPVLRGAPFVVCSLCNRLVQLPTDFAVPSRGTRRLQCGSCSEILSYSYRDPAKKKHQSSSGDEEYQYSTDDYEIHQAADHHRTTGYNEADPFSYSEEYGVSYSTEDEHPLHVSRNSSFDTIDERNVKLHRLMGYSSASELLRRRSPDLYESFGERTPVARTYDDRKGKGIGVAEEDDNSSAMKGSKARGGGFPLHGILKKGIHELESL